MRILSRGSVRVDLRCDLRPCAQVFDDITQTLLDEQSLLVVEQLEPVIRLCRNDHRNEHRVVERRERICLQISLHKLQFVLFADSQQAMVAVFGRRKCLLIA